jgi:hypothetical protein
MWNTSEEVNNQVVGSKVFDQDIHKIIQGKIQITYKVPKAKLKLKVSHKFETTGNDIFKSELSRHAIRSHHNKFMLFSWNNKDI